jgi:hypothetical protein
VSLSTSRIAQLAAAVAAGAILAGGGFALAASGGSTIHGCVGDKSHTLTVQSRCPKGTHRLIWDVRGPQGPAGPTGATGATGATGPAGTVPWTIDYGYLGQSAAINFCSVTQSRGLGGCKYLGVGYYQVTATGCDLSGASTPATNIQLTPDATEVIGQNQANPSSEVRAEVDGYVTGPANQLTFGIRVLGTDQGAAPSPIDAPVYILVNC